MRPSRNRKNRGRQSRRTPNKQKSIEDTLTIETLGRHGHGIAETVNGRVFVPYALTDENVRVKVSDNFGELIEIIKPSGNRIEAVCPHFGVCGGCAVQHLKEEVYLEWKSNIVTQALRHKGLDNEVEPIINAHGEGRRRVTLHVRRQGKDILVGFMQARSHRLNDIQACLVLEPALSDAVEIAHDLGRRVDVSKRGFDVQLSSCDTGLDCSIMGVKASGYDQYMSLAELAEKYDLARLALDGEIISERRRPQVSIGQVQVTLPIGGFLQATREGERVLSGIVCNHANEVEAKSVVDLFCGIGPYALRLAGHGTVRAIDNNSALINSLTAAVRQTPGLKPVEASTRDLFEIPVSMEELQEIDFVVFNPPRAGALEQARTLAESVVPTVISVSCDPATFARDASILIGGGYSLDRVVPVDQFRWSSHVEVVGIFTRR